MINFQECELSTIENNTQHKNKKRSKLQNWLFGITGAVLLVLLVAYLALHIVIDANFIEDRINRQLTETTGGLYSIKIESINFSLANRSFNASGVSLSPSNHVLNQMQPDSLPSFRYEIDISGFSLDGINLLAFMGDDKIEMNSLQINDPVISLMIDQDLSDSSDEEEGQNSPLHARLAQQLPQLDVADLSISNATLAIWQKENGETREQIIESIDLVFENIKIDSVAAQNEERILFSDDVRLNIEGFQGDSKDGVYNFKFGPVYASTRDATLQLEDVSILPTITDTEFVDMKEVRESRYMFISESIIAEEIDYRSLLDNQNIIAGSVEVKSFLLDVFSDLRLPRRTPTKLPHETVQELGIYLNIREVYLNTGQINYSEQAKGGIRPGIILLDSTHINVQNITNDPEMMTIENPAVISVQTLLNGKGELNARIEMPLLDPNFPITLTGELDEINAESFNSILVDLEGVKIVNGDLYSVIFDIQSSENHATGTVRASYEDLEIEVLDPGRFTRDFGDQLQTFIANNLLLRSSGDLARAGEVDNEMDNMEDSFLNFLVDSLLDGLLSSMVIIT